MVVSPDPIAANAVMTVTLEVRIANPNLASMRMAMTAENILNPKPWARLRFVKLWRVWVQIIKCPTCILKWCRKRQRSDQRQRRGGGGLNGNVFPL